MRKRYRILRLLWFGLLAAGICRAHASDDQKIAEGEFQAIPTDIYSDPKQLWVLWRQSDGTLRLENHFHISDPTLVVLAAMDPKHLSAELKRDLSNAIIQSEMVLLMSSDWKPIQLLIRGTRFGDSKEIELLKCLVRQDVIDCAGVQGKAKFKRDKQQEFLYQFSFPLLLRAFALRARTSPDRTLTLPIAELELAKDGPKLFAADLQAAYLGDEVFSIGDHKFNGRKYSIEIRTKSATLKSLLWLSGNDVVLGEQPRDSSNEHILMTQFKRYSDF